jgi:hypothetical protein
MTQLNERQIAYYVGTLLRLTRQISDAPQGYIMGAVLLALKRSIENKTSLTDEEYSQILKRTLDEVARPEFEKARLTPYEIIEKIDRAQEIFEDQFSSFCQTAQSVGMR